MSDVPTLDEIQAKLDQSAKGLRMGESVDEQLINVKKPTDKASFAPEGYVPPNSADGCEVRRMNLEYKSKQHEVRMLVLNGISKALETNHGLGSCLQALASLSKYS